MAKAKLPSGISSFLWLLLCQDREVALAFMSPHLPSLYTEILMKDVALLKSDVHQKVLLVWFFTKHVVFSTSSVYSPLNDLGKREKPKDIN